MALFGGGVIRPVEAGWSGSLSGRSALLRWLFVQWPPGMRRWQGATGLGTWSAGRELEELTDTANQKGASQNGDEAAVPDEFRGVTDGVSGLFPYVQLWA